MIILKEGPTPHLLCGHCGIHLVHSWVYKTHLQTYIYKTRLDMSKTRQMLERFCRAEETIFLVRGQPLE